MKLSQRTAHRLLSMALCLILVFTVTGLAEDTPIPAPSCESEGVLVSESETSAVSSFPAEELITPSPEGTHGTLADTGTPAPDATPPISDAPLLPADTPPFISDTPLPLEETATPPPPICELTHCPHILVDERGVATALCPLGEWMLVYCEPSPMPSADVAETVSIMDASIPTVIILPVTGSYTLYRSGTYTLTGGGPGCKLIVSENCLVALHLNNVQIGALQLGARCIAEITFHESTIGTLSLPDDAALKLLGEGSLTVGSLGPNTRDVTVVGGSVSLPAGIISANGTQVFTFSAPGSTGVMVNGSVYPYTQPCPDGKAHVWLLPLEDGQVYEALMNGTILEITTREDVPSPSDDYDLALNDIFTALEGHTYTIAQSGTAIPQTLRVDASNVTLMMNGISAASPEVNVEFSQGGTLHLSGGNNLHALEGTAGASLTGSGSLSVVSLNIGSLSVSSGLTLSFGTQSGALNGWYSLAVPGELTTDTKATVDGRPLALAYSVETPSTALLPKAPPAGKSYSVTLAGTALTLKTIPEGEQSLVLTDAGLTIDRNGTYKITTSGPTSGAIVVGPRVKATVTFAGVDSSSSLTIGNNANITLVLEQSSLLGGGINLGQGSALVLQGAGALLVDHIAKSSSGLVSTQIKSPANLTLPVPGSIAGTKLQPTVLFISNSHGAALPNTKIVLKLGKNTPFSMTTNKYGFIYLWRSAPLSSMDAVVLSDANTYATVLVRGSGDPNALPDITGVTIAPNGAVTYSAPGAATSGVQYYINRPGISMPDTYRVDAGRVLQHLGECNIPGLRDGDQVIFRVFACAQANVTLTAETADAFAFSDQYSFTASGVRSPFTLAPQYKTYNGREFTFASGLIPKGASLTWFSGATRLEDAPHEVGRYTAKVSILPGHPDYLPGVTDVLVDILPITVLIFPEEARKVVGEPDPSTFLYTYDPASMLPGDEVTGKLTRMPGEKPGNYPYLTDALVAKPYYRLKIDPLAPMFFIDYSPHHYMPFDPLARIDPVHDVLVFSDGSKLDLIIATVKKLNISGVGYGEMIFEADSGQTRPFTASLRLRSGYDAALLILRAEPELNEDGGYVTDMDGNPVVTGRTLTLTYAHLEAFRRQRITHIAFGLQGIYGYLELPELQGEAVRALMTDAGLSRLGARFCITLRPVTGIDPLLESASAAWDSVALQAPVAQVRMEVASGSRHVDITRAMNSARLLMDVSSVLTYHGGETQINDPDVVETVIGQRLEKEPTDKEPQATAQIKALQEASATLEGLIEPTSTGLELARQTLEQVLHQRGCSLSFFSDIANPLDSLLVVPYTFSETQAVPYTAILRTKPYLIASLVTHGNGLYGLAFTAP